MRKSRWRESNVLEIKQLISDTTGSLAPESMFLISKPLLQALDFELKIKHVKGSLGGSVS